jgi:hypothetical protein
VLTNGLISVGNTTIVSDLRVNGQQYLTGSLNISGLTNLNNSLNVSGISIFNSNITTLNSLTSSSYREKNNIFTVNSNLYEIDCLLGSSFVLNLQTSAVQLTINNIPQNVISNITLFLDGGSNRAITWPSTLSWGNYGAPTLSTEVNKIDVITLVTYNGGTKWLGFFSGKGF